MAQALFANQRESNLASTVALIDEVLVELGYEGGRVDASSWRIRKGSATVSIALVSHPEFTHLRLSAVVMTMDAKVARGALFAHLLELNATMCGNAFALDGDHIVLVAERSTLDLDRSELLELVGRVTSNADQYDDLLVAAFGGSLGG
ncbi:MAG TPA: YbjN domain-containing protein [Kofleriaceae bacterium]|jgi:hypothetical protein